MDDHRYRRDDAQGGYREEATRSVVLSLILGVPATILVLAFTMIARGSSFNLLGAIVLYVGLCLAIGLLIYALRGIRRFTGNKDSRQGSEDAGNLEGSQEPQASSPIQNAVRAERSLSAASALGIVVTTLIEVFNLAILGLSFDIFRIIFLFVVLSLVFAAFIYFRHDKLNFRGVNKPDHRDGHVQMAERTPASPPKTPRSGAAMRMSKSAREDE